MFSENNQKNNEIKEQQEHNDFVQFFDLLLKIDMRQNPDKYKNNTENND